MDNMFFVLQHCKKEITVFFCQWLSLRIENPIKGVYISKII